MSEAVSVHATPPGWGSDDLSDFIEHSVQSTYASYVHLPEIYAVLQDIDALFIAFTALPTKERHIIDAILFLRAHCAYRGAVRLALSGQTAEAHMVARGCIENAIYADHMHESPEMQRVWLERSDSAANRQKMRSSFKIGKMIRSLAYKAPEIGKRVEQLYEATIDFGAHPNELGVLTNVYTDAQAESETLNLRYLTADSHQLRLCMLVTAQVGFCALEIFQGLFPARFGSAGIADGLSAIREKL